MWKDLTSNTKRKMILKTISEKKKSHYLLHNLKNCQAMNLYLITQVQREEVNISARSLQKQFNTCILSFVLSVIRFSRILANTTCPNITILKGTNWSVKPRQSVKITTLNTLAIQTEVLLKRKTNKC